MDLRKLNWINKIRFSEFNDSSIDQAYWEVCKFLDDTYKQETYRTSFEDTIYKTLKLYTKMEVYRSIWIGARNIDIFIPAIVTDMQPNTDFKLRGLAIEVDGKIHDAEFKMKKDISKFEMLSSLGILAISIENHDLKHPLVLELFSKIPSFSRLDTRARRRLKRNIQLKTLISNKSLIEERQLSLPRALLKSLGEL
jgi:type II secretory pathway component PulC